MIYMNLINTTLFFGLIKAPAAKSYRKEMLVFDCI